MPRWVSRRFAAAAKMVEFATAGGISSVRSIQINALTVLQIITRENGRLCRLANNVGSEKRST